MEEDEEDVDVWGPLGEATRQCREHVCKFEPASLANLSGGTSQKTCIGNTERGAYGGAEKSATGGGALIPDVHQELQFGREEDGAKQLDGAANKRADGALTSRRQEVRDGVLLGPRGGAGLEM